MLEKLLHERYKLLKVVGQGGMGTVHLALDVKTNEQCAIKEILIKNRSKETVLVEPNLLKRLQHPSLNKIIDIFEIDQKIYIVMDHIDGKSLKQLLISEKKFSEKMVINWSIQLCEVLIYLHNIEPYPIIYRDMKPGNILVGKENKITLIDFGIAAELKEEGMIDTQVAITRGYCAPEQYTERTFDERTDIYSLGITMYHLLTGISPNDTSFELKPIRKEDENISREIEYIIGRAIKRNPDDRYQCVDDLLYDLVNINKLNEDFKKIIARQAITYLIFVFIYLFFMGITYIGYKEIKSETYSLSQSLISQGNMELEQSKYKLAFENFTKAIKLDEYNQDSYIGIFNYYNDMAEYKEGIKYINDNVEKFDKIPDLKVKYNYYLGNYHYKLKDYKSAYDSYLEFNKVYPQNINSLFMSALSNIHLGNEKLYNKILQELISLDLDKSKIYYLQAEKFKVDKNIQFALDKYDEAIKIVTDKTLLADIYISKASLYKNNPEFFKNALELEIITLQEYEKIQGENKNIEVLNLLIEGYVEKSKTSTNNDKAVYLNSALRCYNDILELGKDSLEIYINIAYIYRDLKDYNMCEQKLKEATLIYPNNFLSFYNLTVIQIEIELLKPENARDYTNTKYNFQKAKEIATQNNMQNELKPLIQTMEKLNIKL